MPYASTADLPESVQTVLPLHAQGIFKDAYNNAWEEYRLPASRHGHETRQEISYRIAWCAVNRIYQKGDGGKWHRI